MRLSLTFVLGLFTASATLAQPAQEAALQDAHYLVFQMEEDEPRLIFAQRVRLDAPLEPRPAAEIDLAEGGVLADDAVLMAGAV